jgi:short-subunit dehydrogenase
MKNIIIIGATSAIAEAAGRIYANEGHNLFLFARNQEKLSRIANDYEIRGANQVIQQALEATAVERHEHALSSAFEQLGNVDILLIAYGSLPDQEKCINDSDRTLHEINVNATSVISLLTHAANLMETQEKGTIAVITSVAGDRGRQSNYVYGSAKGMISIFLQGLRNRLFKSGIHVVDIKPGFVDTPMTSDFDKGALWATPEKVAEDITKGIEKKKCTIYTPFFWKYILMIIKIIPESIFRRLSL